MSRTHRDQKKYLYKHHHKTCNRSHYAFDGVRWGWRAGACECQDWWDWGLKYWPVPSWWNREIRRGDKAFARNRMQRARVGHLDWSGRRRKARRSLLLVIFRATYPPSVVRPTADRACVDSDSTHRLLSVRLHRLNGAVSAFCLSEGRAIFGWPQGCSFNQNAGSPTPEMWADPTARAKLSQGSI